MKFQKLFPSLLLICLFIASCSETDNPEDQKEETLIIPVEASEVNRGNISAYYANTATLEAEYEATVVSKVRGILKKIHVEEGDYVNAGQIIAQIEDDQYRIEAARSKATLDRLHSDFQRNKELFGKNLIAAETFQNSQYEYESQKSAYELAELNLSYTEIKSPISGVISERFAKAGNMLSTDQQVYRVTDFDPLKAVLYIPEHEMPKIRKGQKAQLQVDALPGHVFEGNVERISPVVDPMTGTFKTTVFITDSKDLLRPGMFGRIKIVYDTRQNTRMIPKSAVISEDMTKSVYVIVDSLAFKKNIITGYSNGFNVEVLDGLTDGEIVVTVGQGSLQDSSKVNIVKL